MKSWTLTITIVLFSCFFSCEKVTPYIEADPSETEYCINNVKDGLKIILLSEEELNGIKSLFESNHLDYSQLQFYRLQLDNSGNYHVRCNQYVNGLKVFAGDVIVHFKPTGIYYSTSGELISSIDLDTLPKMNTNAVVERYLDQLNKDVFYSQSDRIKEIRQGCFDIEFGYCNVNAFMGISSANYIKAWKVSPKGKEYPYAYINDASWEVIYYDNGIRY